MEAAAPEVVTPVVEEVVAEVAESGPNVFLLFLIFIPTFLVAYLIPLIATIYSKNNAKKWIFYWLALILSQLILYPILTFILGAYAGAFLFLIVCAGLLYVCSNQKAHILIKGCDIASSIVQEQWSKGKETAMGLAKQFGILE